MIIAAALRASSATHEAIETSAFRMHQDRGSSSIPVRTSCAARLDSGTPLSLKVSVSSAIRSRTTRVVSADAEWGSLTETILRVSGAKMLDNRIDLAVHYGVEVMHRVADAMIGHAILREIVGSDFRGPVAGSNLCLPHSGPLGFLLCNRCVEETGAKNFHSLQLVLQLVLLILLADDNTARDVSDANCGIRCVVALSAWA
jgi:hypothetical protein